MLTLPQVFTDTGRYYIRFGPRPADAAASMAEAMGLGASDDRDVDPTVESCFKYVGA